MWIRKRSLVLARMPSMRPFPLNPRPPAAPGAASGPEVAAVPAALTPSPSSGTAPSAAGSGQGADEFVRPGGFHESSYELQHGLQVSESEWPVEVAMPTPQGSH